MSLFDAITTNPYGPCSGTIASGCANAAQFLVDHQHVLPDVDSAVVDFSYLHETPMAHVRMAGTGSLALAGTFARALPAAEITVCHHEHNRDPFDTISLRVAYRGITVRLWTHLFSAADSQHLWAALGEDASKPDAIVSHETFTAAADTADTEVSA